MRIDILTLFPDAVDAMMHASILGRAQERGCEFVLVSPLRSDLPPGAGADWVANKPGSDTALMQSILAALPALGGQKEVLPASWRSRPGRSRTGRRWSRRRSRRR